MRSVSRILLRSQPAASQCSATWFASTHSRSTGSEDASSPSNEPHAVPQASNLQHFRLLSRSSQRSPMTFSCQEKAGTSAQVSTPSAPKCITGSPLAYVPNCSLFAQCQPRALRCVSLKLVLLCCCADPANDVLTSAEPSSLGMLRV